MVAGQAQLLLYLRCDVRQAHSQVGLSHLSREQRLHRQRLGAPAKGNSYLLLLAVPTHAEGHLVAGLLAGQHVREKGRPRHHAFQRENRQPVNGRDDIALLQAGVVGRASGYHLRDTHSAAIGLLAQQQTDEGSPEPRRLDFRFTRDSLDTDALLHMALAEGGRGSEEAAGRGQPQGQHGQGQ